MLAGRLALILGLAGAAALVPAATAQNDPGVAEAIRFQKAEDAAAARQARLEAGHGSKAAQNEAAQTVGEKKPSGDSSVQEAIRFQQSEDAAAARQARIESGRDNETNSADRMMTPKAKSKASRTTSATARKTTPAQ